MSDRFVELAKSCSEGELVKLTQLAISRNRYRIELRLIWVLTTVAFGSVIVLGTYLLTRFSAGSAIRFISFLLALGMIWIWFKVIAFFIFWTGRRAVVREAARAAAPVKS